MILYEKSLVLFVRLDYRDSPCLVDAGNDNERSDYAEIRRTNIQAEKLNRITDNSLPISLIVYVD